MTAVHQLLPVLSPGDAIGNATFRTQRMLRNLGFTSEIFAGLINSRLSHRARPAAELDGALEPTDALVYHLSIGSELARTVERTRGRRILVYHNITPPAYYRDTSARVVYWLRRGLDDLSRLAPLADLAIGVSAFNLQALMEAGACRGVVVPPPLDFARLHPSPATPSDPPMILFVGRLAPNKRQEDLIRALAALRGTRIPDARLNLLGGSHDTSGYVERLRRFAERLDVADAVCIPPRHVEDAEVADAYRRASVFACASEHEGFGMPLVEAMAFEVPVLAFGAGAVPETVGDAGVVTTTKDPLVWADLLARLITDDSLRRSLVIAGRRRVVDFSEDAVSARLASALVSIGLVGNSGVR